MNAFRNFEFNPFDDDETEVRNITHLKDALPAINSRAAAAFIINAHRLAVGLDKPEPKLPPRGSVARLIVEAGRKIGVCW